MKALRFVWWWAPRWTCAWFAFSS